MNAVALLVVFALIVGVAFWTHRRIRGRVGSDDRQSALIRLIVLGLLLASSILVTVGVGGLLERLLGLGSTLVRRGASDLARDLAFVVVGGPAATLLWSSFTSRLRSSTTERRSMLWGLYLGTALTLSLVVAAVHAIALLADLIGPDPADLARNGAGLIAWGGFWLWHRRIWAEPDLKPGTLPNLPILLGSAFGLVVGATGVGLALGSLLGDAYGALGGTVIAERGSTLDDGVAAAAVGAAIWVWHWWLHGRHLDPRGGWLLHTLGLGVMGGLVTALTAVGSVVFALLTWWFAPPRGVTAATHFDTIPGAVTALVVGGGVWAYHRAVVRDPSRTDVTEPDRAARYLQAGIGLAAAAGGLGVVVASIFQSLAGPVATVGGATETLLAGITALGVGGPLWALTWRDLQRAAAADPATELTGTWRRVYLVVLFGVAGIAALITLLVIAFRLFEAVLEGTSMAAFLDSSSTALGILFASGTVAGYHLVVWRSDRASGFAPRRRLGTVHLVTGADDTDLAAAVDAATDVKVVRWLAADTVEVPRSELAEALTTIDAERVLVLPAGDDRVRIVPYRPA